MPGLKKNISYNLIYQILMVLLPLVTSPIISRRLGPEMSGVYSFTYSIAYYFTLFGRLGIGIYGNRTIAAVSNCIKKRNKLFWSLFYFQLLSCSVMLISYILFCLTMVSDNSDIMWIQILALFACMFDITWFLFGIEEFKVALIRNFLVKVTTFVLVVVFVKNASDISLYTYLMGGSTLLGQLILIPYVIKMVGFYPPRINEIKIHIKPNLILFLPSIAISFYQVMDKIMLGALKSKEELGYYEYAEKIIAVINALITAIEQAMIPRLSNLYAQNNKSVAEQLIRKTMYLILLISPPLIFGMVSVSRIFAPIYWGNNYSESGVLICILAPGLFFSVIGSVIRSEYIIPNAMDKEYVKSLFLAAISNVIGNYLLIPLMGARGASISTVIAEMVITIYIFWVVSKKLPLKTYFKDGIVFVVFGLVMMSIVYFVTTIVQHDLLGLIVSILVGAVFYFITVTCFIWVKPNDMNAMVKFGLQKLFRR